MYDIYSPFYKDTQNFGYIPVNGQLLFEVHFNNLKLIQSKLMYITDRITHFVLKFSS